MLVDPLRPSTPALLGLAPLPLAPRDLGDGTAHRLESPLFELTALLISSLLFDDFRSY